MKWWVILAALGVLALAVPLAVAQFIHPYGRCIIGVTPSSCAGRLVGNDYPNPPGPDEHVGAVELGDECYPCGWNDSVCPEIFQDPSSMVIGDCAGCPDPDCQGAIEGYVSDNYTNARLADATVTVVSATNSLLPTYTSSMTLADGFYRLAGLPAGRLIASASRLGYDTQIKEVDVAMEQTTHLDFELVNGTCHADCTDAQGRCGACQGINGCDYPVLQANPPTVPVGVDFSTWCLGRRKGDLVPVSPPSGDYVMNIECCDKGLPEEVILEYRPLALVTGCMKNVVTQRFPARLDGQPVLVNVAVWPAEECPGP